ERWGGCLVAGVGGESRRKPGGGGRGGVGGENLEGFLVFFRDGTRAGDKGGRWGGLREVGRFLIAHAASPDHYVKQRWRRKSSGRLHCREIGCRHPPDAASCRRHCALHCKCRRCYPTSRWGSPPVKACPSHQRIEG